MEKRLKIEDVFTHPWVVAFEKEQEKINKKNEKKSFVDVN